MIQINGWSFPDFDHHLSLKVGDFPVTVYQQSSIDLACNEIREFNQAIDIGANVGLHSVRFSQKFKEVISFEPTTLNFNCLKNNCSSLNNVRLENCGLGIVGEETAVISIPKDNDNCGAFSIVDFKDHTTELIQESIVIKTLDSFNLSPNLIKIDTQGYEMNVLQGAVNTILKSKPVLLIECEYKKNIREVNNFLLQFGYTLVGSVKKDKVWAVK
jgi:FkbM family methyltransferase